VHLVRSIVLLFVVAVSMPAVARQPVPQQVRQAASRITEHTRQLWSRVRREHVTGVRISYRTVGDWSTASLLMASANQVVQLGSHACRLAPHLAGFGSVGLGIYSLRDFVRANTGVDRLEATHGIAWSLQGLAGLGQMLDARGAWIAPTAKGLGVAGGVIQAGVGGYRLTRGVLGLRRGEARDDNRARIKLALLDMGAGCCWAAAACGVAAPYSLGGFIVLTAARMAYGHRDSLKRAAGKLAAPFRRGMGGPAETTVIVTSPTTPQIAARALRGPGTRAIHDEQGRTAVVTPATVKTSRRAPAAIGFGLGSGNAPGARLAHPRFAGVSSERHSRLGASPSPNRHPC